MINYSRYDIILPGKTLSEDDKTPYPDPLTFPIHKFYDTLPPSSAVLTQVDLDRFDLFVYRYYKTTSLKDFVLWYNKKGSVHEFNPGDRIYLPSRPDIEKFYQKWRK